MTKKRARMWIEKIVRDYGDSLHREALSVIFAEPAESRPTVRPKRAVQQRKVSTVRSCTGCSFLGYCPPTATLGKRGCKRLRTAKTVA